MTALAACLALVATAGVALTVQHYARDLPDYQALADYAPPTVTRIHAGDGRLMAEYAKERRVFVPIDSIPDTVKDAFISAEDQRFWSHRGVDILGIVRTLATNVDRLGDDHRRLGGASTITQQVAKNFLLTPERSFRRKIKEAILALRIERAYSKERILELYLNEIYLGNRAYGVAAAALNYFDKSLADLSTAEAAFLAGLPQAPSRYDPTRNPEAALARRAYVLGQMRDNGYLDAAAWRAADGEPLTLRQRTLEAATRADFFTEEVRRQLVASYGEAGFYEGGLSVRTTLQPRLQAMADRALRDGLADYDRRFGWAGPVAKLAQGEPATMAAELAKVDPGFEMMGWRLAAVIDADRRDARLVLDDATTILLAAREVDWAKRRRTGSRQAARNQPLAVGDVVVVEQLMGADGAPGAWTLRQRPAVEGALVALDPNTGRVLALAGGFSFRQSNFNRATQALRQPGSAFKPFVYLAGLESGLTPASIIVDGPIAVAQGPGLPLWQPENYSQRYYGPSTLRLGLEKSRNLMTVRLAQQVGMPHVQDVARRFGIDRGLGANLAGALGSNEVTPLALAAAYGMLANGGRKIEPFLVDRIQDRTGATIQRRDHRACTDCMVAAYDGGPPAALPEDRPQVADPRLAYQMVAMLQGVVERGTAAVVKQLGRPLAGKTGTTNDSKDAWFVGFSPDLVVAVFIGFDQPKSLGSRETGGSLAVPIWMDFMREALAGVPPQPFRTPPGLQLVAIDAATGRLAGGGGRNVIREPFLPGTEPTRGGGGGGGGGGGNGDSVPSDDPTPSSGGIY